MSRTIELPDGTHHTLTDEELERGEAMMARLREVEAALVGNTGQTTYSEQLLPCPFCGGEARIIAKPYEPKVCVGCDDDTCLGFSGLGWLYDSDKEATEAWNRRAERTCRDTDYDTKSITCSECGETTRNTLFWVDVDGGRTVNGHRPRFCSNCGAKVVSK